MSVWSGSLEEISKPASNVCLDQVMLCRSNNHRAWPLWPDTNRHKSTTLSVNCGRDRFAAGDHFFRNVNTISASHLTVFRENAGLLSNTPLTNFQLMDACPQISYYLMTKLLQHFLLSLCSYTLSLVIERCQEHNQFVCNGAKGIFTPLITMSNPLLHLGVITFLCSLPPSSHLPCGLGIK